LVVGSNPTARANKTKKVAKIREYFNETVNEMIHNVSWPTWKELQGNTIIVVIASIIIALFIFVMDFGFGITAGDKDTFWKGAMGFIYDMF
jgi:preprotein translocase subunit SecE